MNMAETPEDRTPYPERSRSEAPPAESAPESFERERREERQRVEEEAERRDPTPEEEVGEEAARVREDPRVHGPESSVERLVEIANETGVAKAVKVARKMDDPYILDRLHDELAEYPEYKQL